MTINNCIKCRAELPDGAIYCSYCGKKQVAEKRKMRKRANGTGTVYRPWEAAKNGVVIGYYSTRTAALEAIERITGKEITERYNLTFAEVFAEWKEEHYKTIGKVGQSAYETAYKVFTPLHNRTFRQLRTRDFQACVDKHLGKSYSTLNKYKQLVTQMSSWAIREEICTTNFASYVRLPENETKEKEIFTDEEIVKLEADDSEAAKIVLMLIYTGMRIGELFALPLADYHNEYVVGGSKTDAGRNRVIPIRPEGRKYFAYFAQQATGDMLLSGYVGQKVANNYRKRDYYPLLKTLGIPQKTPHATRHTYASWARRTGMRPEILQKILGHSKFETTANIYVHTDATELVKAVEHTQPCQ